MGLMKRDLYSNLKFFQALVPQDVVATLEGETVDLRGHDACVMAVNCGLITGGALGGGDYFKIMLEHGLESALGVSEWSEVYPSQMIHSVVGLAGAYSTLNSGVFQSVASTDDISAGTGKMFVVGYKGPRRFLRVKVAVVGNPSALSLSAQVVLGGGSDWPAQESVGD